MANIVRADRRVSPFDPTDLPHDLVRASRSELHESAARLAALAMCLDGQRVPPRRVPWPPTRARQLRLERSEDERVQALMRAVDALLEASRLFPEPPEEVFGDDDIPF